MELAANLNIESLRKQSAPTNKTNRVKIERGHAWLIRLLPFPQGPAKESFAHLAQHWIGGRAVMCKQYTSPNFGGDPSYDCPICFAAATGKNEAMTDDEKDDFYGVEVREVFRCYCLVWKRQNDRGDIDETREEEMYTAYEFNIPKTSFNQLCNKFQRSNARSGSNSGLGVLDFETGCDIWVGRDSKNSLTFDLEPPQPIFELDDQFDAKIDRVWKNLKQPSVKFLAVERENALADMISEKAFEKAGKFAAEREDRQARTNGSNGRGNSRGGSNGRFHEAPADEPAPRGRGRFTGVQEEGQEQGQEQEPEQEQPAPRTASRGRANPLARAAAALGDGPADGGPGGEDDQVPGAEVPPRRSRPMAETAAPEPEQEQEQAPPVSPRRGGATARPAPTRVTPPAAVTNTRRANAPAPPPKGAAPAANDGGGRVEDETQGGDEVPEEQRDPTAPEQEQEPAPAAAAPRGVSNALRGSIGRLANR